MFLVVFPWTHKEWVDVCFFFVVFVLGVQKLCSFHSEWRVVVVDVGFTRLSTTVVA